MSQQEESGAQPPMRSSDLSEIAAAVMWIIHNPGNGFSRQAVRKRLFMVPAFDKRGSVWVRDGIRGVIKQFEAKGAVGREGEDRVLVYEEEELRLHVLARIVENPSRRKGVLEIIEVVRGSFEGSRTEVRVRIDRRCTTFQQEILARTQADPTEMCPLEAAPSS